MSLTPRQLQARKKGIFGSDASVIEGTNQYKDLYTLYQEKVGLVDDRIPQNTMMQLGHELEGFVRGEYADRMNVQVTVEKDTMYHRTHKFVGAHLDGHIDYAHKHEHEKKSVLKRGLEIKLAFRHTVVKWGKDWTDKIPPAYRSQIKHYALVTGILTWDIAWLNMADGQIGICTVVFTKKELAELLKYEKAFWKMVTNKTPPPVNSSDSCKKTLKKKYPYAKIESCRMVEPDAERAYLDRQEAHEVMTEAHKKKMKAENFLAEFAGKCESVVDEEGLVLFSLKNVKKADGTTYRKFKFN